MRYPLYAINFLSSCRRLWYELALKQKPKVYLYDVKVDSCDSVTRMTKICQHYKVVVIPLKQGLCEICETREWQICDYYWDEEDLGRSLSLIPLDLPDRMQVKVLVFIGADQDQVSLNPEAENRVEGEAYPLKLIQKTFLNELPNMKIPDIAFLRIDARFVGYVRGKEEALALEKAVTQYEEMGRNGAPFSLGCELQRTQIPGNGLVGATPKTLSVALSLGGPEIVNSILEVSII